MKPTTKQKSNIATLAKALKATSEYWVVKILDRMGVEVADDGTFDTSEARNALETFSARSDVPAGDSRLSASDMRIAQMGNSKASVQEWLRGHFGQHDLKVIGGYRSRMTLQRNDDSETWINTYISMTDKSDGRKAGFSVSGINLPELPWFAFVVQPWGEVYLRRREEIVENLGKKTRKEGAAFVTISRGRIDDLFGNRIDEMKNDENSWSLQNRKKK